jgi:hypothetical protein
MVTSFFLYDYNSYIDYEFYQYLFIKVTSSGYSKISWADDPGENNW